MAEQSKPQVVKKPIPLSGWIKIAQLFSFAVNSALNWVVVWAVTRPPNTEVASVEATNEVAGFWDGWGWLISIVVAVLIQVVFVYVPMFIEERAFYGKWRKHLQRGDTFFNYAAFVILATQVIGIAPELNTFVTTIQELLDELIRAFGQSLNLETVVTLVVIYILSETVRNLSLITTLIPKERVEQKGGGGGGGGGNNSQQKNKDGGKAE